MIFKVEYDSEADFVGPGQGWGPQVFRVTCVDTNEVVTCASESDKYLIGPLISAYVSKRA